MALPVVKSWLSMRPILPLPMNLKAFGSFRVTLSRAGTASSEAAAATSPKPSVRFDLAWVRTEFSAFTSAAGTPHCLAAAWTSMAFAAAPAWRRCGKKWQERARAVGVLVAETSFVTPGLGDLDLGPIRLELVGDDEGDGGAHALAHLRAMAGDGDGAVRRDGPRTPSGRPASHAAWHRRRISSARPSCPRHARNHARTGRAPGRPCRRAWRGG